MFTISASQSVGAIVLSIETNRVLPHHPRVGRKVLQLRLSVSALEVLVVGMGALGLEALSLR